MLIGLGSMIIGLIYKRPMKCLTQSKTQQSTKPVHRLRARKGNSSPVGQQHRQAVKRLRICKRCIYQVACFQAVRIKLSLACYRQPHKLVSRGILKAYNFFGKAQNRVVNLQDIRIEISFVFEKSESFPFPTLFFLSQISMNVLNFLLLILRDGGFLLYLPSKLYAGN